MWKMEVTETTYMEINKVQCQGYGVPTIHQPEIIHTSNVATTHAHQASCGAGPTDSNYFSLEFVLPLSLLHEWGTDCTNESSVLSETVLLLGVGLGRSKVKGCTRSVTL